MYFRPVLLETENKDHKTPLIQAIEQDNSVVVHLLINLGANVNNRLKFTQRTPLMIAIYRSRLEIASYLIDKGAHISAVDVNGLNILHFAVESNVLDNVIYVINLGIDVNSKDRHGWTVLKRSGPFLSNSCEIVTIFLCFQLNWVVIKKLLII